MSRSGISKLAHGHLSREFSTGNACSLAGRWLTAEELTYMTCWQSGPLSRCRQPQRLMVGSGEERTYEKILNLISAGRLIRLGFTGADDNGEAMSAKASR